MPLDIRFWADGNFRKYIAKIIKIRRLIALHKSYDPIMERNCKFFRLAYHKSKLMQSDKKLHFLTHKINFQKMGKNFHLLLLFVEDASVSCSPDPTTSSKNKNKKRIFTNGFDKLILHVWIAFLFNFRCLKKQFNWFKN